MRWTHVDSGRSPKLLGEALYPARFCSSRPPMSALGPSPASRDRQPTGDLLTRN
jgi:hypothetical protein